MSSSTQTTIKDKTLSGLENLNRVLPTGTVFLYQLLSPVLTNHGQCSKTIYKYLTVTLVGMCGLSCFITSFTDSYEDNGGKPTTGLQQPKVNFGPRLRTRHCQPKHLALRTLFMASLRCSCSGLIVCLDRNTMDCFYPLSESHHRALLEVLPPVGAISSVVLLNFPNNCRGIGYLSLSKSSNDSNSGAKIPAVTRTEGSLSMVSVVSSSAKE